MSVQKISEELDTESTYYNKIESNTGVCSNCFRRVSFEYEPHPQMPDVATPHREYSESVYFEYFDDKQESGRPSVRRSYCKCGVVRKDTKIRPFDKEQTMDAASRVSKRLEEEGVDFDLDVFFDIVKEKKESPECQFNEELIFEEATERSINTNTE